MPLDWSTLYFVASAVVVFTLGIAGFVAQVLLWMHRQIREFDARDAARTREFDSRIALLDKTLSQQITDSRHTIMAAMQRESATNDLNDEARRKDCQDLSTRVTRIEARMNGNHPKA